MRRYETPSSLYSTREGILFCEFLGLVAGRFAGGGEGDVSDVDVGARMVVLGEDALADLTGIVGRTFGKEDDDLTEFLIRTFSYQIRYANVRTELTLELLSLDLQASGADGIVATTENSEMRKPIIGARPQR